MDEPLLSVAGLHAIVYCERLFYLEEVERIRVADARVYAGRRIHVELGASPGDAEEGERSRLELESATLGMVGVVDVLRRRDGRLIPVEHKKGRSAHGAKAREAWHTDRVQVAAYAMLVEEAYGQSVEDASVHYHGDGVRIRVVVDNALRSEVRRCIARAGELRSTTERPPVTDDERRCERCSLASVCLPEEARLAVDADFHPIRLLPAHPDRQVVHVMEQGATVGRAGREAVVRSPGGSTTRIPVGEVGQVVIHGLAQISTQALRLCASQDVGVHWMTFGGGLVGSLAPSASSAQRHLRQFRALADEKFALALARRLVRGKLGGQLRFLLRATRGAPRPESVVRAVAGLRRAMLSVSGAGEPDVLLGIEGSGAAAYFSALPSLIGPDVDPGLSFDGRSRRPPADRFNALLGYGYGMLYREVLQAIVGVGLHPGFGFYHRPRSAAQPLALDLVELFRIPVVDMAIVAAVNRRTFDPARDFEESPGRVLLSEEGRRRLVEVIERRKNESWRHTVVGYSLSYARTIELEVRLLEKEWMKEGGLFGRIQLR